MSPGASRYSGCAAAGGAPSPIAQAKRIAPKPSQRRKRSGRRIFRLTAAWALSLIIFYFLLMLDQPGSTKYCDIINSEATSIFFSCSKVVSSGGEIAYIGNPRKNGVQNGIALEILLCENPRASTQQEPDFRVVGEIDDGLREFRAVLRGHH